MADVYVRSGAAGSGTGANWANAYTTLTAAFAAKAAGDTFWVADDHAETNTGAVTLDSPGSVTSPCRVICVDRTGTVPPVAADLRTTATVTCGTTSGAMAFGSQYTYFYGITFTAGAGSAAGANINIITIPFLLIFESCGFVIGSTNTSLVISIGAATSSSNTLMVWRSVTVSFAATGQMIQLRCPLRWLGPNSSVSGTVPSTLIQFPGSVAAADLEIRGVDLSAVGSGKYIVANSGATWSRARLINCKLNAAGTVALGNGPGFGGTEVTTINCDSGNTNYKYEKKVYEGTITTETTIVRTGGASDGTTNFSRKLVTTANPEPFAPLEMDPIVIWNELTSSITITVHTVTDNVTLTDAQCWIEVEELGTSGFPMSVTQSDRAATLLTTAANQTTSTETWTTTGLTTPVKQKLSVTFTPASKGPIYVRVMLAKVSTTVYVCPKVEVS